MIKNAIINSINEKKEIGNLNASNSDTLTRSQSFNKKNILTSSNSQECINNLVSLGNNKNKLEAKDFLSALKTKNFFFIKR